MGNEHYEVFSLLGRCRIVKTVVVACSEIGERQQIDELLAISTEGVGPVIACNFALANDGISSLAWISFIEDRKDSDVFDAQAVVIQQPLTKRCRKRVGKTGFGFGDGLFSGSDHAWRPGHGVASYFDYAARA